MISSGSTPLPLLFDITSPSPSSTVPWITTSLNGSRPIIDSPNITIRETTKLAGELLTLEEMRIFYLGMESWSQMVYDRLRQGD